MFNNNYGIYVSLIVFIFYIIYILIKKKELSSMNILIVVAASLGLFIYVNFTFGLINSSKSLGDYEEYRYLLFFGSFAMILLVLETLFKKFKED